MTHREATAHNKSSISWSTSLKIRECGLKGRLTGRLTILGRSLCGHYKRNVMLRPAANVPPLLCSSLRSALSSLRLHRCQITSSSLSLANMCRRVTTASIIQHCLVMCTCIVQQVLSLSHHFHLFSPYNLNFDLKKQNFDSFLPSNQNFDSFIPSNQNFDLKKQDFDQFRPLESRILTNFTLITKTLTLKNQNFDSFFTFESKFWPISTLQPKFWHLMILTNQNFDSFLPSNQNFDQFRPYSQTFDTFCPLETRILTNFALITKTLTSKTEILVKFWAKKSKILTLSPKTGQIFPQKLTFLTIKMKLPS